MAGLPTNSSQTSPEGLQRGLRNRHIQLIALGGSVGLGLFLASGAAIHKAGPALLLGFAIGGVMFFLLLRALGELALYRPVSGSFASYAEEFLGPFAGFFTGWTYWGTYIVLGMAELTAVGKFVQVWLPTFPQWIPALLALLILIAANLFSVRVFGEAEFWIAIVKVLAVLALILTGIAILAFGVTDLAGTASISNLWKHDGFFPNGLGPPVLMLQFVVFSFFGLETLGIAAGEAADPQRSMPKAINSVILRVAIFYIGAVGVIMCLISWNKLNPNVSPFVEVFNHAGMPAAAVIINVVIITAALSVGNSAIFVTTRMLFSLAERRHAPQRFQRLSRRQVPTQALMLCTGLMFIAVVLNYLVPEKALAYVMALATLGGLVTWISIMLAHMRYSRAVRSAELPVGNFRLPGAPWTNLIVLGFIAVVIAVLPFNADGRPALIIAPFWAIAVTLMYRFTAGRGPTPPSSPCESNPVAQDSREEVLC